MTYTQEYLTGLLSELRSLPKETEWVEFKHNNEDPREIGEYISALSNAAVLAGKTSAYLVWGVEAGTHSVLGTNFDPKARKVGNEELESWLLRLLSPKINFYFHELFTGEGKVVLLEIDCASRHPVRFQGMEYIRIGSYKKTLKEFPEREREMWRIFDAKPFEELNAAEKLSSDDVLRLLDYPAYFELTGRPLPDNKQGVLESLASDSLVVKGDSGYYNVSNLGAILFAKKLDDFKKLKRKAVRVVVYKGNTRTETIKEQPGNRGYASGFAGLIEYINGLIPRNEVMGKALRKEVPMYPVIAVRELVANALIHQDFFVTGAGPMVEIFSDRMEITNPGIPLVKTERFLDSPPRSRNESLASLMRRIGVCEERGSGVDKVVSETEFYQLPAPLFEVVEGCTKSTLFSHRPLSKMSRQDRIRATYLHACLKYVQREYLTNASLRERFLIKKENISMVSRIIKDVIEAGFIKPVDPKKDARRHAKYVPFWA